MYASLTNGVFRRAPKKLSDGNVTIYNPTGEQYRNAGYKPVEFTTSPEAPEGYYYDPNWKEQDEAIVQVWHLEELPPEEASEEDYAKALAKLGIDV